MDNEKAFDRIWHNGLFLKLYEMGIKGKMWHLLYQSYTSSSAFVQYCGLKSNEFAIQQGVGQGRVLSSWFFLLFIDDLIRELRNLNSGIQVYGIDIPCILLADDTTLASTSPKGLQTSLDTVYQYACKWRLTYNGSKSTCIVFSRSNKRQDNYTFKFGELDILIADSVKYGGILLSSNLSCKARIHAYCQKARQSVNSLSNLGLNCKDLHPISSVKIWKRMILPTSFYGCELLPILRGKDYQLVESTQRYFARRIQGFDKRFSSASVLANLKFVEYGWIQR